MTNAMIIFNRRVQLMEEGIIGATGRYITVLDKDGNESKVAEPEMIHTYAGWKAIGRQVKKGEKAVAMDYIWKYTTKDVFNKGFFLYQGTDREN